MQTYAQKNAGFITQSKLKVFSNNPEEYKLKYIDGIEKDDEDKRHFIIWTAIHDLLWYWKEMFTEKYFLQEKNMLKQDYIDELDKRWFSTAWKVDELKARFFDAIWNKIKLTAWESEMILSMYAEFLRQPKADVFWDYEKEKQVEVEYKWLKLRGTLDRIDLKNKVIRDWKTTASIPKLLKDIAWGDDSYLFQTSFYWLMAKIEFGIECKVILDIIDKSKNTCYYWLELTKEQILGQIPQITQALDDLIEEDKKHFKWEPAFLWVAPDQREKTFESDYYKEMKCSIQQEFEFIETNQK